MVDVIKGSKLVLRNIVNDYFDKRVLNSPDIKMDEKYFHAYVDGVCDVSKHLLNLEDD